MGMFDRIWFKCPKCEADIEVQSKCGECILEDFNQVSVPPEIAKCINWSTIYCQECGAKVRIEYAIEPPHNVPMEAVIRN